MRRSCAHCAWAEPGVNSDGPTLECHLLPPATMPHPEPLPDIEVPDAALGEAWRELGEATLEVREIEFHRYPAVTAADWCSHWEEVEA